MPFQVLLSAGGQGHGVLIHSLIHSGSEHGAGPGGAGSVEGVSNDEANIFCPPGAYGFGESDWYRVH